MLARNFKISRFAATTSSERNMYSSTALLKRVGWPKTRPSKVAQMSSRDGSRFPRCRSFASCR